MMVLPPGMPIHLSAEVTLAAGASEVGPKNSQYSTPAVMFQVTTAVDCVVLVTASPSLGGEAELPPPPQPTASRALANKTAANLIERKNINTSK